MKATHTRLAICGYLDRKSSERVHLSSTLAAISAQLPDTAIFGGMIREFAWGHARDFSSDIDLVTRASKSEIYKAISRFRPTLNRFGGYRFIEGKRCFDIWALEDTWAVRENLVAASEFEDLFGTTFFGVDAAIFHLKTRQYKFSPAHDRGARERMLELNLRENPFPHKMARRAVLMALKWDLAIESDLGVYIVENWQRAGEGMGEASFVRELADHLGRGVQMPYRFRRQTACLAL